KWHGIIVLLVLLFVFFRISGHRKLEKQLQILKDQGYPVTIEELEKSIHLPKGVRNAADIYKRAFASYVEWDREDRKLLPIIGKADPPARTQTMNPETRQLVEKFLSDNEQTLSLLYQAAGVEHCRYKIDLTKPWSYQNLPPEYKGARLCISLFSLEALLLCENPDPNRMLESVRASLALADSVNVPLLNHHLFRNALRSGPYRDTERILNRISPTDAFLLALSESLNATDYHEEFKQALIGEQCRALHTFQLPVVQVVDQISPHDGLFRLKLVFKKILGSYDKEVLRYIGFMQDCFKALDLPDNESLVAFESIQKRGDKRGGLLTRKLMWGLALDLKFEFWRLAHQRVTQTGLAIERYRLAKGGLPGSLKDLVPAYMRAVPLDPYDGRSLKYRKLKTGYVVYSIGYDMTDDGGAERGRGRDGQGRPLPWDITFIMER
ncbi:MAG: hypothetical protein P8Z79_25400, partial [Sedimentisphaerales bacterium]